MRPIQKEKAATVAALREATSTPVGFDAAFVVGLVAFVLLLAALVVFV
jgi:hypothetical protein